MIIDTHIHCGKRVPYETIVPFLKKAGIEGACVFAPVDEVYDRNDPDFNDTPEWQSKRREANRYLLEIARTNQGIYPYLFVWNDFDCNEIFHGYRGIKWHRHEGEPVYNYEDKRCHRLIEKIIEHNLPIVFEENYPNTLNFINNLAPDATVIIPHLGWLNGGFFSIDTSGIWKKEKVYADSSLASKFEITMFLNKYGADKLIFGSDFPFSLPENELKKITSLDISESNKEKILGGNIKRLLGL
ncbi:MAG: amidohydrolase family protein [Nitrospirae bacterium]|nr:amidohydrolase family protein [Nitrospirota bacterium]